MRRPARRPRPTPAEGPRPWRTCLGCRGVRSQADLIRLIRTPEGRVEPDPRRRQRGRGAYVCRRDSCLEEAVRRARWAHAFRASAQLAPEAVARLRAIIEGSEDGIAPAVGAAGAVAPVEGGW